MKNLYCVSVDINGNVNIDTRIERTGDRRFNILGWNALFPTEIYKYEHTAIAVRKNGVMPLDGLLANNIHYGMYAIYAESKEEAFKFIEDFFEPDFLFWYRG